MVSDASGGTDDEGDDVPDELREFVESVDGGDGEPAPTTDAGDDEFDTDPRSERFGHYAGGLVTVFLIGLLFVGPWRLLDVSFSVGMVPFELRESTQGNIFAVGAVVIALVCFVTGAAYRATTRDVPEEYRWGIATNVVVVQMVAALALFVLVMLVPIGESLLSGDVVGALLLVLLGAVYLLFFTFFEVIGICLYVGIPAILGVYAGSIVGSVVSTAPPEAAG